MSGTNGDLVSKIEPCSKHREKSPTQNAVSETKVSETWSPKQKSPRLGLRNKSLRDLHGLRNKSLRDLISETKVFETWSPKQKSPRLVVSETKVSDLVYLVSETKVSETWSPKQKSPRLGLRNKSLGDLVVYHGLKALDYSLKIINE